MKCSNLYDEENHSSHGHIDSIDTRGNFLTIEIVLLSVIWLMNLTIGS